VSKMSGVFAWSFKPWWPKSIDFMSIVTSTVPAFAALSNVILPAELLNLPRHTDMPPLWSASNDGYVCAGSIS